MLAGAAKLLGKDAATRRSDWGARERLRGAALEGSTIGIVGFGGVGADLARLLQPLGVRIVATNRRGTHPEAAELGVEFTDLDDLLRRSHHVVLTAALNASTHRMVDVRALGLMRPDAFLVNIGRGGLVDTDALREALRAGAIRGAGLDVVDPEPLDPDDELLTFENVVLSPHALCWTADFTRDTSASALEAVIDVATGRRPRHLLNPQALTVAAPA
nr:NAD(P)-dependent oxidoreductase [Kineococcus rhizosphaerae]